MADEQTLLPVSDGDAIDIDSQFPAAGSHWEKVADWDAGTYVFSSVAPYSRDLYNFQNFALPAGYYIVGIELQVRCNYDGAYSFNGVIKTHGVEYTGPAETGTATGVGTTFQCYNNNPFTNLPWTESEINDIQAGVGLIGPGPLVECWGVKIIIYYRLIPPADANWHIVDETLGQDGYSVAPNFFTDDAPEHLVVRAPSGRYFCVYGVYGDYTGVYPGFFFGDDCRSLRLAWSDNLIDWSYAWVPFTQVRHWYATIGIVVDSSGNVYVLGREYEQLVFLGDPDSLVLSKFSSDGVLLGQDVFETGVNGLPNVYMQVDGDDNIHITWFNYPGRNPGDVNKLYYRRRNADGTWEAREELDSINGPWAVLYPSLTVDINNVPHIVYYLDKYLAPGYWCYRYIHLWKPNGGWLSEVIHEHPVEEITWQAYSVIRASPDDKLHVSYSDAGLFYIKFEGGAWTLPIAITDPGDPAAWNQWENQPFVDEDSRVYAICTTWDTYMPMIPKADGSWGPTIRTDLPVGEEVYAISVMNSIFPLGSHPSLPGPNLTDKVVLVNSQGSWPYQILLWGPVGVIPPTVTTNPATLISQVSATLNGILTNDGGEACECGFEWGLDTGYGMTTPTEGKVTGETFSQTIGGLSPGTIYHFRAFATNSAGTGYGADRSFTTTPTYSKAYALSREEL